MADLQKIETGKSSRSRPSRRSSPDRPWISKVFTGQHLDDYSTYQSGEEYEESDMSERVSREENQELGEKLPEETVEVRDGIRNVRDLEAPLEKKQSTRSIKTKDPNLVSMIRMKIGLSYSLQLM